MTTKQQIENATYHAQGEGVGLSRVLAIAFISIVAGVFCALQFGCATYQMPTTEQIDGFVESVTQSEAYAKIYAEIEARVKAYEDAKKNEKPVVVEAGTTTPNAGAVDSAGDAVAFSSLKWTYGGWDGSKARFTGDAVIGGLSVNNSGMSYKWVSGGCEAIGAANGGDFNQTMACLFILEPDGVWRGGKFDWISTSRKTRSFTNILGGYHGWNAGRFKSAKEVAFVIVSKGGYRTNVIKGAK